MADRMDWIKFYFDDFCDDPAVKACPLDTQGWYVHLMKVLSRATPYGCLCFGGVEPTPKHLGNLTGYHSQTCKKHLTILKQRGVLKEGDDGLWYSKRMVEDWLEYQQNHDNGLKGWEEKQRRLGLSPPSSLPSNPPVKAEAEAEKKQSKNKKHMAADAPFVNEFENDFWPLVRKKETKADSRKLFVSLRKKDVALVFLISGLREYQREKAGDDVKYLMQPKKFLGPGRHWEEWAEKTVASEAEAQRAKEANERRERTVLKRTVQPTNPNPDMAKQLRELAKDLGEGKAIEGIGKTDIIENGEEL